MRKASLQIEAGNLIRFVIYVFTASFPAFIKLTGVTIELLMGKAHFKLLFTKDHRLHPLFVQAVCFTQI